LPLKDAIERLQKYARKLEDGKADEIKPSHVQKVIDKLTAKHSELAEELADATKPSKRERLEHKMQTTRHQLERARALLAEIEASR
jgi:hypothetical protein